MYVMYVYNECDCAVHTHTHGVGMYVCISGMGCIYVAWCGVACVCHATSVV